MIRSHPYRAVGAVAWFGFLASVLAILVLSAYLAVAHYQGRRQHRGTPRVRT